MHLGMRMVQIQTLRHHNEYSQTIFPEAENLLNEPDAWQALHFVANRKNMDGYRSVMDFLFCELMGSPWIGRCKAFYNGNERTAKDWMSPEEIFSMDKFLCVAIWYALDCHTKDRQDSWTKFRFNVIKLVA